jgi:hypothetical protein
MFVGCDGQCHKAWGNQDRKRQQLSDIDDDWAYLADDELGEAPAESDWWEGGYNKPESPTLFPNKWCVRACERCSIADTEQDLKLKDFSQRFYNMPSLHTKE